VTQGQTVRSKIDLRRAITSSAFVMIMMVAVLGLFALFSIWSINRTWIEGMERVSELRRLSTSALEAQVSFKVQVQEWKNILLRGDDPELLAKYRAAFAKQDADTRSLLTSVAQLAKAQGFDEDAQRATALVTTHADLTQNYEVTLKEMQGTAAVLDAATAHAIDVKLRGADRALETGIGRLATDIGAASDANREALITSVADRYNALHGFIISVILGALAVMGFVVYRLLRLMKA
jgi:methyl-accepting chemotaxis protein